MRRNMNLLEYKIQITRRILSAIPWGDREWDRRVDDLAIGDDLIGIGGFDHDFELWSDQT
jgi:hypothetical protein